MYVPAGRTIQLSLCQPGRHPRLLRPAVPVQARRRAGPDQHVRVQGQGQRCRPDVPRPVRRAVRLGPRDHAVRCPRHDRRRLRLVAASSRSPRPTRRRHRPAAARSERRPAPGQPAPAAAPPVPTVAVTARTSRTTDDAARPRPNTPFKIDFDNQDRARRTTSRSTRAPRPARRSSRARSSRASPRRPTTSRRCRPAPTPSCARSTRT